MKHNYIDGKGVYHNELNLTLAQIYDSGVEFGCMVTAKGIIEELEKLKTKIEEIKMKEPLMSKGFECYGFKDKTPEDIKTETIEIIENYIEELKGE